MTKDRERVHQMSTVPTEDEVAGYFEHLSNWGRWGADDEMGTLNLITPDVVLAACATVRDGVTVGCARPIVPEDRAMDVMRPPIHYMYKSGESESSTGAADFLGLACHGLTVTHVDALSHRFWDGKLYNGWAQNLVNTGQGATVCSVETMRDGIVTRGVLLDIAELRQKPYLEPGEAILPADLAQAEREHGVTVRPGDALLVRTGWFRRREELGPHPVWRERPGLHAATLPWLRERDVALVGADAAQDVIPSGYDVLDSPVHMIGIRAMGLCLLDNLQLEDLAAECRRRQRWEFLFSVAPLRIRHGTGSPVTPLAVL